MKIVSFGPEVGRAITQYGSMNVVIAPIARLVEEAHLHCIHLGRGGVVGNHPTTATQLFLVVAGEGWVRDGTSEAIRIVAGQAALWKAGEWHESRTDTGMTAIIVEGKDLSLAPVLLKE